MKMKWNSVLIAAMCVFLSGCGTMCSKKVPSGHVGMCRTADGFEGKPLSPGWHTCWRTSEEMHYLEISDREHVIHLKVLCKDKLNFNFDIAVLASVNKENSGLVKKLFNDLHPEKENRITSAQVFATYARKVAAERAKAVVSQYATTDIVENRKAIIREVKKEVKSALEGSIIEVKRVTVNNLDFPKVVTDAQKEKAKRQVEIETERAEQKKRKLEAKNDIEIAKMKYKQRLIEAATTADANKIIGDSITPGYLGWWQLKTMKEAAKGPNNWGFIPYSDMANSQIGSMDMRREVMGEALRGRIDQIRKDMREGKIRPDGSK